MRTDFQEIKSTSSTENFDENHLTFGRDRCYDQSGNIVQQSQEFLRKNYSINQEEKDSDSKYQNKILATDKESLLGDGDDIDGTDQSHHGPSRKDIPIETLTIS